MNEDRLWMLLSLQLAEEANPEEIKELEELLKKSPELSLRVEMLRNLWHKKQSLPGSDKVKAFDKHLQRLSNHLSEPVLQYETNASQTPAQLYKEETAIKPRSWYRRLWATVAIAASVIIAVVFIFQSKDENTISAVGDKNTVSTQPGSKSKIQLPDGTQVWLNAGSKITYNNDFSGDIREVRFSGEAFFNVAKDKERPFIIHTSSVDIKVLGTALNVRSYPNEKTTEMALIRGSVEIILHDNPDKKILLKPNEKLVVNNITDEKESSSDNERIKKEQPMLILSKIYFDKADSSTTETQWINDTLAFDSVPLEKIMAQLERFYNVKFLVKDEKLKQISFTGGFNNKSLDEIMEALCLSGNFHFEFNNETVTIW